MSAHVFHMPVRFARSEVIGLENVSEPCVTVHGSTPETFMLQIRTRTERQARMTLAPLSPAQGRALIAAIENAIAVIEARQDRMNEDSAVLETAERDRLLAALNVIAAIDEILNVAERVPTGDDFNEVVAIARRALESVA